LRKEVITTLQSYLVGHTLSQTQIITSPHCNHDKSSRSPLQHYNQQLPIHIKSTHPCNHTLKHKHDFGSPPLDAGSPSEASPKLVMLNNLVFSWHTALLIPGHCKRTTHQSDGIRLKPKAHTLDQIWMVKERLKFWCVMGSQI
jgi:hypothetical protein